MSKNFWIRETECNYLSRLYIDQINIQALNLRSYLYCLMSGVWGRYLNILFAMDYIFDELRLEVTDADLSLIQR